MNRPLVPTLVFAFAAALVSSGCTQGDASTPAAAKADPPSIPVETGHVTRGELVVHYEGTAALEAEHEAKLVAEQPGSVLELLVEEGAHVKKGQVLARLDADKNRLELLKAEADLEKIKHTTDRNERLLARQLIGRNVYEQSTSDFATRRADVDLARVTVRKSEIRAPFDGIVTRRWVKLGQLMAVNDPVFDVADFSDLKARLRVPERDADALRAGQPATLAADALPGQTFVARIERVAPIVDRASGTVLVTVAVDNRTSALRPGLFCRLDVAYDHIADATLMPKAALLGAEREGSVFAVEDGKAKRTHVELGLASGERVQIVSGLAPGAEVVVAGQSALEDGMKVDVLQTTPVAAVATTAGSPDHG